MNLAPGRDILGCSLRSAVEGRVGYEYALRGAFGVETAGEIAYLWIADLIRPTLGLNVDFLQAERVLIDDTVDATVTAAPDLLPFP